MTPLKKYKFSTVFFAVLSITFMAIIFAMSAQPVDKSSDTSDKLTLSLLYFLEPDLQEKEEETPVKNDGPDIQNTETDTENKEATKDSSSENVEVVDKSETEYDNKDTETNTKADTENKEKDEESVTTSTEVKKKPQLKPTKNWFGIKPGLFYTVIRKSAHFLLFMGLGISLLLTFVSYYGRFGIHQILLSIILSFLYACSDEFHQLFVSGRGGGFDDVKIDFSGSLFGIAIICLVWITSYLIKRHIKNKQKQKNA